MNGVEDAVGDATVVKGELVADFTPYQVRSFALKLGAAPATVARPASQAVKLAYDQPVASTDRSVSGGRFDSSGRSLPAEMLPANLPYAGVTFTLGPANGFNAMVARGQTIPLPAGTFTRVYLLAAADSGDQRTTFRLGATPVDLTIQDWGGYIGQWDNRIWKSREEPAPPRQGQPAPPPGTPPRMRTVTEFAGLTPGFIKPAPVAWFASHRHASRRLERPVRVLLPVCLRDRHPGGRHDADAADERADQDPRGDGVGRSDSGAAGRAAVRHADQIGSELTLEGRGFADWSSWATTLVIDSADHSSSEPTSSSAPTLHRQLRLTASVPTDIVSPD